MIFETIWGTRVKIPKGYKLQDDGYFMNGHGVEYAVVRYGWKENITYCLETIFSKHTRTVELEVAE